MALPVFGEHSIPADDMIEPSEDSFETMMERNNPSSKQMESSEGSSNTVVEAQGGAEQEGAGPASGQGPEGEEPPEKEELPTDLLQDMEGPSSGPREEIEDPPNDLLQDVEESCNGSDQAREDLPSIASDRTEEGSVSPPETQEEQEGNTNLKASGEKARLEEENQTESAPEDIRVTMGSIISLHFRTQDLSEQQRVAEEILVRGLEAGQLPPPRSFSGDRREYHEFVSLCQLTLQSYPATFYTDQLCVMYVMSHLSGFALERARALIQQNGPLMENFPAFLEAMSEVFEYRQELRVAEEAMFYIRQGHRSATEYITEFQSLIPTLGWSDEVLQAHLCHGLSEDIRTFLFRIPQPDTLNSLIMLVLQVEDRLRERKAIMRLSPESSPRNLAWVNAPAPARWVVNSWVPGAFHPDIHRAHFFLLLLIRVNPYHSVAVQALVDSGAIGSFMDERFAQAHCVELYRKPYADLIQTVNGDEAIWLHTEALVCMHQNHHEFIQFDIVPSSPFSVVLGTDWLRTHAPDVDWIRGRVTFHSPYCLEYCFRPPPPCIALESYGFSLLPGLPLPYSDLADVFNPKEADEETSDQPSSDGSDGLSESEPSELQQAGDSDHGAVSYGYPFVAPRGPVGARMQEARLQVGYWDVHNMLTNRQDYEQTIPGMFDPLHGATCFTRLVLRGTVIESASMNRTEDTLKEAFGVEQRDIRSYQPFALSSDPVIPQYVIHFILKGMLGHFVASHGREVLVYSMCSQEHPLHVRQVLVRFRYHRVYCSLRNSQFSQPSGEIMAFRVTPKGVRLNQLFLDILMAIPVPNSRRALQHLLALVLPYSNFVERFAILIEPLARLLLGLEPFRWGVEEQEAFECLKRAFRHAPLLHHPRPHEQFFLETGINGTSLYATLLQVDELTGRRVPCAFHSRDLSPMEVEYPLVEMRVLPIRASFMVWYRYLENTEEPIMILLNTEDLASLNNDRLTVLLPGHWAFFFSHFNFDVMEMPALEGTLPLTPVSWPNPRPWRNRVARPILLLATRGSLGDPDDDWESWEGSPVSEPEEPPEISLQRELLTLIPIEPVLGIVLARFGVAQIRAVIQHFFRGLLYWKNVLPVATLLLLLDGRQRLALPPAPALQVALPAPRRSLRLLLDSTLVASGGLASAVVQLLGQLPPIEGANAGPAHELAQLFLGPGHRQRNAVHPPAPPGLQFTPGFWMTLCEFFGVRVTALEAGRPAPRHSRYLELHVVGDEDVVLREALQDDLQRYRQCGLHDGLQDTSQDAQDNDVQDAPSPDEAAGRPLRLHTLMDPEVLDFLNNRLLHIRGPDGQLSLLSWEEAARALAQFLITVSTWPPVDPLREEPSLEELPDLEDHDLD
ncbi:retrotransposon-like protein 1 [Ctenodactylus gundi]